MLLDHPVKNEGLARKRLADSDRMIVNFFSRVTNRRLMHFLQVMAVYVCMTCL